MNYKELLRKAKSLIPKAEEKSRLTVPEAEIIVIGKQTIIRNFMKIAQTIRRDAKHFAKFLFKELAIPGSIQDQRLILNGIVSVEMIKKRIDDYIKKYVLCEECKKLDTILLKEGNMYIKKCESCGAKKPIGK